ncbi:MAG: peptidylprolyl isomerase [Bacteroidales bacterium]|nr:peptidylprolyl isomerase [Bacteroidales bacterium]
MRTLFLFIIIQFSSMTIEAKTKSNIVLIETSLGNIKICLYDETPQHRDNFLKLVEQGYYQDLLFHRVIKDFMVQGGDPESKGASANKSLGSGGPGYQIPAEILYPQLFHKRGALSAARTGDQMNPQKESSGSQFYIVWGSVYSEAQLAGMENQKKEQAMQNYFGQLAGERREMIQELYDSKNQAALDSLQKELVALTEAEFANNPEKGGFTAEQKEAYSTVGGTPHLDGEYTVFGEVIEGLDIVEKIQSCQTGANDRPKTDITMKMEIAK